MTRSVGVKESQFPLLALTVCRLSTHCTGQIYVAKTVDVDEIRILFRSLRARIS